MVPQKRIDGFIITQDESDALLRQLKIKEIHREYYQTYDDVPIVRKDSNGDEVDRILSAALVTLKNNGQLQKLWEQIHVPYENWQPSDMNW